jgi:hypothetical protein
MACQRLFDRILRNPHLPGDLLIADGWVTSLLKLFFAALFRDSCCSRANQGHDDIVEDFVDGVVTDRGAV